ncbi:MAG: hypothetical protein KJO07_09070, partial [Deltaproteobacteria bacterium]|nr:hypothetical protein [Deltaproteobacteria bacterium]
TSTGLGWEQLSGKSCPESCTAEIEIDLVTVSIDGDILVDTHLRGARSPCSAIPRVELAGSIRVFEREALVIEEKVPVCNGKDAWGTTSVIGVRNTDTTTLLSLERSRVLEVDEVQLRIEHSAEPGAPAQVVRMIPGKQEDRLVFRAEPEDAPKVVTGADK